MAENKSCCDGELKARVRATEVYIENHAEKLVDLTDAVKETNVALREAVKRMDEIKVQQKVTHILAGIGGTVLAFVGDHILGHR